MDLITIAGIILLALVILLIGYILGKNIGEERTNREWGERVPSIRKDAVERSRAIIGGKFSEQLAPYLPDFDYKPTEVRFIGQPIDFIVFKGMDEKEIEEVVFVEVKSGKSSLSSHERKLRDAIKNKNVKWELYKIPEELTK